MSNTMAAINLGAILESRGESLLWLAKKTNIEYKSLHRYLTNESSGIQTEHISAICNALDCEPNDLFTVNKRLKKVQKKLRPARKSASASK